MKVRTVLVLVQKKTIIVGAHQFVLLVEMANVKINMVRIGVIALKIVMQAALRVKPINRVARMELA